MKANESAFLYSCGKHETHYWFVKSGALQDCAELPYFNIWHVTRGGRRASHH